MSEYCKPHCRLPLLTPGFSKHTQDVPQVGDTWQCDTCDRRWIVTDRALIYTSRHAPESWWRPLFWFERRGRR